jgi:hypothetical protein
MRKHPREIDSPTLPLPPPSNPISGTPIERRAPLEIESTAAGSLSKMAHNIELWKNRVIPSATTSPQFR